VVGTRAVFQPTATAHWQALLPNSCCAAPRFNLFVFVLFIRCFLVEFSGADDGRAASSESCLTLSCPFMLPSLLLAISFRLSDRRSSFFLLVTVSIGANASFLLRALPVQGSLPQTVQRAPNKHAVPSGMRRISLPNILSSVEKRLPCLSTFLSSFIKAYAHLLDSLSSFSFLGGSISEFENP
jgi:hypothetical protein